MQRRHLLWTAALTPWSVAAPSWPSRPIRLVVPFPPGSSPDLTARALAEPLHKALGQPVVIENKPGAGGNLGTGVVAHAEPDGHTLLLTIQGPLVTAPLLTRQPSYDPVRDLQPIGLVASSPNVLVVDASLGVSSVADFVRLARARGAGLNYGSVGVGSASHLAMEAFKARSGIALTHVPYAGFPQVVTALLGGQVQASFMVPAIAMPQVRAGKLKALAVTSPARVAALADLPSLVELGYEGFEAISWQAILAPAGTPAPVVAQLSQALIRIIKSDEVRGALLTQFFSATPTTPEGLALLMKSETQRWGALIRSLGLRPE